MPREMYILDENNIPKPISDVEEWGMWMEKHSRIVRRTDYNEVTISTVFLGLDHNFSGDGAPVLFETMVFGGKLDEAQERYASWEGAVRGHDEWVRKVATAESGHSPD